MTLLAVIHFTGQATLQDICNAAECIDKAMLPDRYMNMEKAR